MQVSTLSAQLGLGHELNDWYQDATSVSNGHLLIDLSPRTDDRLRYCTNTGSIGYKYIHKLSQLVTILNSKKLSSRGSIPKNVKLSDFQYILYSKQVRENPGLRLETELASPSMTYSSGRVIGPQFTQENFEFIVISSRKHPTYTKKDEQDEIISGKFYQKELIKVI